MFRGLSPEEEFLRIYLIIQSYVTENPKYLVLLFSDKKSKGVPAMTVITDKWYVMRPLTLCYYSEYLVSVPLNRYLLSTRPVAPASDHIPIKASGC